MHSFSFKIYPRQDTAYQQKQSTDYQVTKSNVYQRFYPRGHKVNLYYWLIFGVVGIIMGVVAFIVDILVEDLVFWKWEFT